MRVNNTCENCIRRKKKCSRDRPVCTQCLRIGGVCVYPPSSQPPSASPLEGDLNSDTEATATSAASAPSAFSNKRRRQQDQPEQHQPEQLQPQLLTAAQTLAQQTQLLQQQYLQFQQQQQQLLMQYASLSSLGQLGDGASGGVSDMALPLQGLSTQQQQGVGLMGASAPPVHQQQPFQQQQPYQQQQQPFQQPVTFGGVVSGFDMLTALNTTPAMPSWPTAGAAPMAAAPVPEASYEPQQMQPFDALAVQSVQQQMQQMQQVQQVQPSFPTSHATTQPLPRTPAPSASASLVSQRAQLPAEIIDIFVIRIRPHFLHVPEQFMRNMLITCPLAGHAVGAFMLWVLQDAKNADKAQEHYDKAVSMTGLLVRNPTVEVVLSLNILSFTSMHGGTTNETKQYFTMAVTAARQLNMFTEEGIARLGSTEEERDIARGVAWSMCMFSQVTLCSSNVKLDLDDDDMLIRLPRDKDTGNPVEHPLDDNYSVEIALVSAPGWQVPIISYGGVIANLFLAHKFLGKVSKYTDQVKSGKLSGMEATRVRACLDQSGQAWHSALPDIIKAVPQEFATATIANPPARTIDAWRPIYLLTMYHHARMLLWRDTFIGHVAQSPALAATSYAVTTTIESSEIVAQTLAQLVIKHDAFNYVCPFIGFSWTFAAIGLVAISKLPLAAKDTHRTLAAIATLRAAITGLSRTWVVGKIELQFIDYLESLPDVTSVIQCFDAIHLRRPTVNGRVSLQPQPIPSMARVEVMDDDEPATSKHASHDGRSDDGSSISGRSKHTPGSTPGLGSHVSVSTSSGTDLGEYFGFDSPPYLPSATDHLPLPSHKLMQQQPQPQPHNLLQ
ncbi:hypothetical protein BC831DRAFT_267913 [Entophlyctis helioformis]|nr:hypothetical protein BC831DRAFT_267913 [Entophlyctis helioformis]